MRAKRKTLSKKTRFEVFKRDSFKCQYCGASAPNVLLSVDHIKPVSKGGNNAIVNYITSCVDCNSGKGARELSDGAVLEKQRTQLEALQERREQLEMMMAWSQGLNDIESGAAEEIGKAWDKYTPGSVLNENGRRYIRKWLRKFALNEVMMAMPIAADTYLQFTEDGNVTDQSYEIAFMKIPGICVTERRRKEDPSIVQLNKIRAILRYRCSYFISWQCMSVLKEARNMGVPMDELEDMARGVSSWSNFRDKVDELIEIYSE
ncbi:MAG: HNH endonuclease [Nitrospira sp.]|nr:HNH endonuclease [Nitrospira sp.]